MTCAPRSPRSMLVSHAAVSDRPGAGGVLVADVVAQQQLAQSLPGAHQITSDSLPGADDIAQRLLLAARDPDRVQSVDHQQAQHPLGVALIGLDLIRGRPLDLPRRRDHTPNPGRVQRPRQPVAGRPRLIRGARRTRQRAAELDHLARRPRQPARAQLARLAIDHHSEHRARVHVKTNPTANLRHGRLLYAVVVAARGPARAASIPTIVWGTGRLHQPGRTTSIWSKQRAH